MNCFFTKTWFVKTNKHPVELKLDPRSWMDSLSHDTNQRYWSGVHGVEQIPSNLTGFLTDLLSLAVCAAHAALVDLISCGEGGSPLHGGEVQINLQLANSTGAGSGFNILLQIIWQVDC